MPEYCLRYTNQSDALYSKDGSKILSPRVVLDGEQVWNLEADTYWLLRRFPKPNPNTAYYAIEVTNDRVFENPDVAFSDLPKPLQELIQKRPSEGP